MSDEVKMFKDDDEIPPCAGDYCACDFDYAPRTWRVRWYHFRELEDAMNTNERDGWQVDRLERDGDGMQVISYKGL